MTALFSAGWNGMGMLEDLDRGVLDRFLVSPARRWPFVAGPVAQASIVILIQSLIIIGLALISGASLAGGPIGLVVLLVAAVLLGAALAGFSNGLALLTRQEETLIGAVTFITLPLTFLSTGLMPADLLPGWVEGVARFNPVNWAVEAGREGLSPDMDWGVILSRTGLLLLVALAFVWFATRAFRNYQASI